MITTRTMDNGLVLVAAHMPHVHTSALLLSTRTGSLQDPPELQGLAHFAEHMLFQGAGARDCGQMAAAFEHAGIDANALTGHASMDIDLRFAPEVLGTALALVADMAIRPRIPADQVPIERSVILAEMATEPDPPLHRLLLDAAYPDQPYRLSIGGRPETVASIGVDDLRDWAGRAMAGAGCTLCIAGPGDPQKTLDAAAAAFQGMPAGSRPRPIPPPRLVPGRASGKGKRGAASVHLAWDAPGYDQPGARIAPVAMAVLGGGPTSRLVRRLRDAEGLCYDAAAFVDPVGDGAMASLCFETGARSASRALGMVMDEVARAARDAGPDDLARAKAMMRFDALRRKDAPSATAASTLERLRSGRETDADDVEQIDSVDVDQVRSFLSGLSPDACAAANLGGGPARSSA